MDKALFSGGDNIAEADVARLEIRNYSESVDDALKLFGWNGRVTGCITLQLTADNAAVASGQFVARGQLVRDEVRSRPTRSGTKPRRGSS